ncbi:MAG: hypothetical protein HYV28_20200 [Ignavibacteriales bacterium]|nr:hypothetical protein [Ignavibacteriales bacterium]
MNRTKIVLKILVCLLIAVMFTSVTEAFPLMQADSLLYQKNPNYDYEIALYKVYKKKRANVVMLGNSITHGVNWNELTGRDDIVERGIPADILQGFTARINYVLDLKPRLCFIMGGINDIYSWIPLEQILSSYVQLIKELQKNNVKVVVQSTLFTAKRYPNSADRNQQVTKFNQMLQEYCLSNRVEFLDMNSKLSKDSFLRDENTHDGLHLNANGYKTWGQEVEKTIFRYLQ